MATEGRLPKTEFEKSDEETSRFNSIVVVFKGKNLKLLLQVLCEVIFFSDIIKSLNKVEGNFVQDSPLKTAVSSPQDSWDRRKLE